MKKGIKILIIVLTVFGVASLGGYYYLDSYVAKDTFYEGIIIDEIPMGGLTLEDGIQKLKESKEVHETKQITLTVEGYPGAIYSMNMSDIDLDFNYDEVAMKAFSVGRLGNVIQRFQTIRDLQTNPKVYTLSPTIKTTNADSVLDVIAEDIEIEPVDAQFSFQSGQFEIIKPVQGKYLDRDSFKKSLEMVSEEILTVESLEISVITQEPKIQEEYYKKINGVIGEFSTSFAGSSAGRSHNVRLSAESFKGMLVMPGQEVSYNKTTGPRQARYGYQEAPVIENGELIPGMGGGVCQTSTTLYNALLLADMKIIERSPHSIAPGYVPRGTDAAVATGYLDLVFRNDFDYPVMIDSKVEGTRVYFYIYGDKDNRDYSIDISTSYVATIPYKVHENLDDTIQPGTREMVQEGRNGYKVNAFKSITRNGEIVSTEQISHDYYRERDYIYKVGPEPIVTPQVPAQEVQNPEPEIPIIDVSPENSDPVNDENSEDMSVPNEDLSELEAAE
ncbi:VanW family protein [Gudongella sp. DL1XJH-153]|uniref:VanW family protein n=1 Tax=Gudongella sp. DL1XJH-153 TaxID=3409804 RepID=UPI003BB6B07C